MKKFLVMLLMLGAVAGGLGFWYWNANAGPRASFRTAPVERGMLEATIAASGTIQPEDVIEVGVQVAGRIEKFGDDPNDPKKTVSFGSEVEEGTVLAYLDPSLYRARRDQAKADVEKSRADLKQMEAKAYQAQREFERSQDLVLRQAISRSDYDVAKAAYETAVAVVAVGKAQIVQHEAVLAEAETNLAYTVVKSPVKGVIIDRPVNVGQTVVVGLSSPRLFLIAKDLRKIEVWGQVNEADLGQIRIGQNVRFTVDKYPTKIFQGKVIAQGKFASRLNASMTQNVTTYPVVVSTDNSDGALDPYLTANIQFVVEEKSDALLVPNAALRWRPTRNQIAPDVRADFGKSQRQPKAEGDRKSTEKHPGETATVWVVDGEYVRPVRVRIGLSDGTNTEILRGDLTESMEVVVGDARPDSGGNASNPFTPQMFGGKKSQ